MKLALGLFVVLASVAGCATLERVRGSWSASAPAPAASREGSIAEDHEEQEAEKAALETALTSEAEPRRGGASPRPAPARPPGTLLAGEAVGVVPPSEKMVVSGTIHLVVTDVSKAVADMDREAVRMGGGVALETFTRGDRDATGQVRLRLPPAAVTPFLDWLETQGKVESRRMEAEDVSRKYFDQELAIKNLEVTIQRLQQLVSRPNAELKEVLEIERELTRVRGAIEEIKGEHRYLEDRITRATVEILLSTRPGAFVPPPQEPELKFHLVPRGVLLAFVDQQAREQVRPGGGLSLMFARSFALELEVFPHRGNDPRSWMLSATAGGYSDFLGGGRRRFLNPYLALRLGGGSFNDRGFAMAGADAGLEIFRHRLFFVELSGRLLALRYASTIPTRNDLAAEATLAVGVPF